MVVKMFSSSDEHCVIFMKMNILSLFFLIGQTSFLMASNLKKKSQSPLLASVVKQNS